MQSLFERSDEEPPLGSLGEGIDASLSISRGLALIRGGIVPPCVRPKPDRSIDGSRSWRVWGLGCFGSLWLLVVFSVRDDLEEMHPPTAKVSFCTFLMAFFFTKKTSNRLLKLFFTPVGFARWSVHRYSKNPIFWMKLDSYYRISTNCFCRRSVVCS